MVAHACNHSTSNGGMEGWLASLGITGPYPKSTEIQASEITCLKMGG